MAFRRTFTGVVGLSVMLAGVQAARLESELTEMEQELTASRAETLEELQKEGTNNFPPTVYGASNTATANTGATTNNGASAGAGWKNLLMNSAMSFGTGALNGALQPQQYGPNGQIMNPQQGPCVQQNPLEQILSGLGRGASQFGHSMYNQWNNQVNKTKSYWDRLRNASHGAWQNQTMAFNNMWQNNPNMQQFGNQMGQAWGHVGGMVNQGIGQANQFANNMMNQVGNYMRQNVDINTVANALGVQADQLAAILQDSAATQQFIAQIQNPQAKAMLEQFLRQMMQGQPLGNSGGMPSLVQAGAAAVPIQPHQ